MAKITSVDPESGFAGKVRPGDELLAADGIRITDRFDLLYRYSDAFVSPSGRPVRKKVELTLCREGREFKIREKSAPGCLGLDFETFLMDKQRSCRNKCCFCFIDQMPPDMRETLYYKDDDYRLSVIYGNYVTLTNCSREDIDRIKAYHISPLNISVHATEPELRVKMMKNPGAGNILPLLKELAEAGIRLKAQIVLCRGINDGEHLKRSLSDLRTLIPSLTSVSVVPVGLTRFRDGLEPLEPLDKADAEAALDLIEAMNLACREEYGTGIFYAGDEFYLKAERPLPDALYYENFEQLENGVGMLSKYRAETEELLEELDGEEFPAAFTLATGEAAAPFFEKQIFPMLSAKLKGMRPSVETIRNDYFGPNITVAGLITGQDLIRQLRGKDLGEFLLLPEVMLREDAFLDDVTVGQVEQELGIRVVRCGPNPCDLYTALTGKEAPISQF